MTPTEVAAWLAVVGTAATLIANGVKIIVRRRKESQRVTEALDQAPYVREQLWLGNVGGAVEHLTRIVESQGRYITEQDARHRKEVERLEEELGIERGRRIALEHEIQRLTAILNGGSQSDH